MVFYRAGSGCTGIPKKNGRQQAGRSIKTSGGTRLEKANDIRKKVLG